MVTAAALRRAVGSSAGRPAAAPALPFLMLYAPRLRATGDERATDLLGDLAEREPEPTPDVVRGRRGFLVVAQAHQERGAVRPAHELLQLTPEMLDQQH